jgi:kynurenine formamidase
MQVVNDRIKAEGPRLSRRNFLRGGMAAAGLAVAGNSVLRPAPARAARAFQEMMGEIVDLSHVLGGGIPLYSTSDVQPSAETLVTVEANGFYKQLWTFDEHSSTHMDFPAHFVSGAETVDVYDASKLIAPLVVIDISAKAEGDPDSMVTPDDLVAYEEANGEIPAGAVVAMYSGWESRWADIEAYRNPDADGVMHFPGFGGEAAAWLVTERDINGIGVDTLSLDPGNSSTFETHVTVLGAGKFGVENLMGLQGLIGKSAMIMLGIPRYANGSGGPCRALAMA